VVGGLGAGHRKAEMILLEHAGRSGRQSQREHGRLSEGQRVGNGGDHVPHEYDVVLEGALGGAVAGLVDPERVPEDAITRAQPGHARPRLEDLAGDVRAHDGGEGQPGQGQAVQEAR
jgi:hypothetical protein